MDVSPKNVLMAAKWKNPARVENEILRPNTLRFLSTKLIIPIPEQILSEYFESFQQNDKILFSLLVTE